MLIRQKIHSIAHIHRTTNGNQVYLYLIKKKLYAILSSLLFVDSDEQPVIKRNIPKAAAIGIHVRAPHSNVTIPAALV